MKARCFLRPVASQDLSEIAEFYAAEGRAALAERFLTGVHEAMAFLREHPDGGAPRFFGNPRLRGLRSWPVRCFEDTRLYYIRPERDVVRIIRVLHGKRDVSGILKRQRT